MDGLRTREREVLIVDDDEAVRASLRDTLRYEGYGVETAESGAAAIQRLLGGYRPSIVVLDLMMPYKTGWEVLEVMRHHGELAALPVLVISAVPEHVLQSASMGYAYLRKPFGINALLDSLDRCGCGNSEGSGVILRERLQVGRRRLPDAWPVDSLDEPLAMSRRLLCAIEDLETQADAIESVAATMADGDIMDPAKVRRSARVYRTARKRLSSSLRAVDNLLVRAVDSVRSTPTQRH